MRKLGSIVFASVLLFLLSALPAFAGSELPTPGSDVGGVVVHPPVVAPGTDPGTTAFTGSGFNVTLWMVVAAALLVVGIAFLVAGRRRRATVSV